MKDTEVKMDDEGFEEISPLKGPAAAGEESGGSSGSEAAGASQGVSGGKPEFNVVQTDRDKNGNSIYINVGGMWKRVSKNGKEFYTLRIGQLKLLVFPNDRK